MYTTGSVPLCFSDCQDSSALSDYQRECQLGAQQESVIERWAKAVGVWTDAVDEQLPAVVLGV